MKWPFARRPGGALRQAAALAAIALIAGCGGSDAPNGSSSPSPSPSSPQGGGTVAGPYLLEIRPATGCNMGGPLTFPMTATAAETARYPGVQVLVAGADALELEFLSAASSLTGGIGTTEQGALANESIRLWIRAIGSGAVTRAADGRGQVTAGRMAGYVAFGHASGPEGSLGSCDSVEHSFVLRVR
jgi:hypothetical protein